MSLALALNTALSGLNINRQSLAVLSQNIANANTAGYTRKIVNQDSVYIDGNGAGVRINNISRKVDEYLLSAVRTQGSDLGLKSTNTDYSSRTQILLGKPGSQNSLTNYVTSFFSSTQTLAQTPESATLRAGMVNDAQILARQVQSLEQGLRDLRYQADQDIGQAVEEINKRLADIQTLNGVITGNSLSGKSVGDLLDKRDKAVAEISEYIDVSITKQNTGSITLYTASGIPLVDETTRRLNYTPIGNADVFTKDLIFRAVLVESFDGAGKQVGTPKALVTGGTSSQVSTIINSGKLRALVNQRDQEIPQLQQQLDNFASGLRDEVNRTQNAGIAFPGASSYTGSRLLNSAQYNEWQGKVRIAVLGSNGEPISSAYGDEVSGTRPLTLDLSTLDGGLGAGRPTVQSIIDEINAHFGPAQNRVTLGNVNNIRLASNNLSLPGLNQELGFDLDIENISNDPATVFVTGFSVLDNNGVDITQTTQDVPRIDLASTGTYVTQPDSTQVKINTQSTHNLQVGDMVYLPTPSSNIDGIPAAQLGGYFKIVDRTPTSFTIAANTKATTGLSTDAAGLQATPPYATVDEGTQRRTTADGILRSSLTGNSNSSYYDVKVNVGVAQKDGTVSTSTITYRLNNGDQNLLNHRYSAILATNDGTIEFPSRTSATARALLVDENGAELPTVNNRYTTQQNGYLKIISGDSSYSVAIDSLDSAEKGRPNDIPVVDGTNRSFSYYFELNNFFNGASQAADQIDGSARTLAVQSRIIGNPNLVSLGTLAQTITPAGTTPKLYTYGRNSGDNNIIQQLADIGNKAYTFGAVSGLGQSLQSFSGYAGSFIGTAAANADSAKVESDSSKVLYDGFSERSDSISGVNLDEELANTIIYQNAYSASARVITVANELFDTLIKAF